MTAAPVGVDRVAKRHPRGRRHLVDDGAGVDVEELHAPVLAGADVALAESGLGKQHPGLLVLDEAPAKLARLLRLVHRRTAYRTYVRYTCESRRTRHGGASVIVWPGGPDCPRSSQAITDPAERELVAAAPIEASFRAYAPYSKFHVGAAVRTTKGTYVGLQRRERELRADLVRGAQRRVRRRQRPRAAGSRSKPWPSTRARPARG